MRKERRWRPGDAHPPAHAAFGYRPVPVAVTRLKHGAAGKSYTCGWRRARGERFITLREIMRLSRGQRGLIFRSQGWGERQARGRIGAFLFALRAAGNPMGPQPGWALPVGIICLIAGLTAASFVTWRGRWR